MRKIDLLLETYGESHRNSLNKKIHWVCVPLIFFSIIGLVRCIPFPFDDTIFFNWASIALALTILYYFKLSPPLALGMTLIAFIALNTCEIMLTNGFSLLWFCLILFILAWIGQFYGHKIEGKKPSFLQDIQFLLIGPAWLLHFIYKKIGVSY